MSPAFKRRLEPYSDDLQRRLGTHHPLAEGKHVCIIVHPAQTSRFEVPTKGAADPSYAVGGDRFAVPRATQHDASFGALFCYRNGRWPDEKWIIDRLL